MLHIKIDPAPFDKTVAKLVADHAGVRLDQSARFLTWGADEHLLLAAAIVGWMGTRGSVEPRRRLGTHILLCSLATTVLPHMLKKYIDQERPDRCTPRPRLRNAPLSGKAMDAFPSGHALHIGALMSAATLLPRRIRIAAWPSGAVLVATRVILLAHWTTDVVAGLALGALVERLTRKFTQPLPVDEG